MAGVSKITHGGKEIVYIDYRGMSSEEMIDTLKEAEEIIMSEDKQHLQLSNISGAFATPEFMKEANEFGKKSKALTDKAAIVGVSGRKKVSLSAYNLIVGGKLRPLNSEEDAKAYLTID